jgi:general stress protein 26
MTQDQVLEAARGVIALVESALLMTIGQGGTIHARVVQTSKPDAHWMVQFLTDRRTRKVRDLAAAGRASLAWHHVADRSYAVLCGPCVLVDDVEAKRAIWHAGMDRFHPGGPEDPNNLLVWINADTIEVYDPTRAILPPPRGFNAARLQRAGNGWSMGTTSAI